MRRKFATELKPVSLKDLCHLGGWSEMPPGKSSSIAPFGSTRRKVPGLTPFPNLA
jgi:hypothetical protein